MNYHNLKLKNCFNYIYNVIINFKIKYVIVLIKINNNNNCTLSKQNKKTTFMNKVAFTFLNTDYDLVD